MFATLVAACLLFGAAPAWGQPTKEVSQAANGVIRQVTLYRDQARVTREIKVEAGVGLRVIDVSELPEQLLPESVFAEGDAALTVRAVRVATRPQVQSNREEIRTLDDEIEQLQQQRDEIQNSHEISQANLQSLEKLISFSVDGAKSDLSRGVLNAETLTELTTFAMTNRKELATEQFKSTLR